MINFVVRAKKQLEAAQFLQTNITGSLSSTYEKLNFLLNSVLSHNLQDLGLYGERNRAKNCEKLLLNFDTNCLPELQWWFYRVLGGFLADLLRLHRVTILPFALSFSLERESKRRNCNSIATANKTSKLKAKPGTHYV